jgi:LuxR family maltose regulon positive regulatory protein
MTTAQPAPQPGQGQGEPLLTVREREVAFWVAHDLSDKEIALKLNVSSKTIKNHAGKARLKLRLQSRVGLALWYARHYGFPKVG